MKPFYWYLMIYRNLISSNSSERILNTNMILILMQELKDETI